MKWERSYCKIKYCLKCGTIWSDSSRCKDDKYCMICGNTYIADDGVTSEQYESFSEEQKDEYEKNIQEIVKQSPYFNERYLINIAIHQILSIIGLFVTTNFVNLQVNREQVKH